MKYQVADGVLASHLDHEVVLLHPDAKEYYQLNETAAEIWKCVERRFPMTDIATRLTREFDVPDATASAETERVVNELLSLGVLVRTGGP